MGSIEIFDHTADVGFKIRGRDLNDLFQTAAQGVFDYIVVNRRDVRIEQCDTLSLAADSPSELLTTWLNELIYRLETEHRLFVEFDVTVADDGRSLHAVIGGEPIDHDRHVLDHEVKAVTHHGLALARIGEEWVAEMILDI
ncbi:SHS2 domain-containing protein [Singulisphaera sp. GP187]|uniref:archease n=1 Tax=Singulisphaera sp. GP187 TaxID=1882752 RepID=UPI000926B6EE|nr:archease [Singulisphaera sp. GP187]SIN87497.1 SHS2 domain-containing protein [Singulisphaera sp. GP187]